MMGFAALNPSYGCVMQSKAAYRVQATLGLIYVCAGSAKLIGTGIMVEAFDVAGLGQSLRVAVGILEVCGGLCLFIPHAAIYAAVVLGCTIVGILGAMVGHTGTIAREPPQIRRPLLMRANLPQAGVVRAIEIDGKFPG
jgi:uncharacterized membrane protein YphA (DoxX/SURF4 family)